MPHPSSICPFARLGRVAVLVGLGILGGLTPEPARGETMLVFIGTYTKDNNGSKGIYTLRFDAATGKLSEVATTMVENPSFVAIHPGGKLVYSVGEMQDYEGKPGGAITAWALGDDGKLTKLNQVSSRGSHPCHVAVHPSGRCLTVANYSSGSVVCVPLAGDGTLVGPGDLHEFTGHGPDAKRQDRPHAHSTTYTPDGSLAIVADLGTDKLRLFDVDAQAGKLTPHTPDALTLTGGTGPRHMAFHPDGRTAYCNGEMGDEVFTLRYDAAKTSLQSLGSAPTLPPDAPNRAGNTTAEVAVHPSGRFVYASNRGHDSLAVFAVGDEDGTLTPVEVVPSGGKVPRNFAIDPTGKYLICAHQESDNLVIFKIDGETGRLTPTGDELTVPAAVCVKFHPTAK